MWRTKCKQVDKARVFNLLQDQRRLHVRILQGLHACNDIPAQSARSFVFYVHSITAVLHGNLRLRNHGQASHWTSSSRLPGCGSVEYLTVDFCSNQMVPAPVPGGQSLDSHIMCSPFFILANRTSCSTCSDTLPCFWGKRCLFWARILG